jgi:hypothetical protein
MKRLTFCILIISAALSVVHGQDVNISSSFDTSRIQIGDQIYYTITVDQPNDIEVVLPELKDTLFKSIEILEGPDIDSTYNQEGRIKIIEKYLITAFDSGFYEVPPVFAETKNENGIKRYFSDYAQLKVFRVNIAPADTTAQIYDIIGPYKAPLTLGEILPWILLVIICGIIVWGLIKYLPKLKKSKTIVIPAIKQDPAHIIAFRDLEKIKEEKLWQKGEIKNYYTSLTEILRQYLENRFRIFSLELTTEETLTALIDSGFKKDSSYRMLKEILSGADLVKFAKNNPDDSENEIHFQNSWDFIDITKETGPVSVEENKNENGKEDSL